MTFLFTVKSLASVAIAGYRTTVSNTLEKVTGQRLTDEHLLASLINQFEVERPCAGRASPDWDLALVLDTPHFAPVEPLAEALMWALTFKTCLLDGLSDS